MPTAISTTFGLVQVFFINRSIVLLDRQTQPVRSVEPMWGQPRDCPRFFDAAVPKSVAAGGVTAVYFR